MSTEAGLQRIPQVWPKINFAAFIFGTSERTGRPPLIKHLLRSHQRINRIGNGTKGLRGLARHHGSGPHFASVGALISWLFCHNAHLT
jgi:hypothetical protein